MYIIKLKKIVRSHEAQLPKLSINRENEKGRNKFDTVHF